MSIIQVPIKKTDTKLRIVYGEVYVPWVPDSHNEFMSEENVRLAAHGFLMKGLTENVDRQHDNTLTGCYVVESFVARKGDPDFIEGSWVAGVQIVGDDLWADVESGEINGFSLEALVTKTPREVEVEIPEYVEGETFEEAGHTHRFTAHFSDAGEFLGGETDRVQEHSHKIQKGTITDTSDGHSHRFAFVDLWVTGNERAA